MCAFLREAKDGTLISVKVQPRASRNEIGEALGNELRIKVTAPPVDSAANEGVIQLFAESLDYPRSRIVLVRGGTSRHKVVKVCGLSPQEVGERLGKA